MDLVTALLTAASVGISLYGSHMKQVGAKLQQDIQKRMIGTEQQEEALRQQMMNISANRQLYANARNLQRARSLIAAKGVSAGAQFGSGVSGGLGQASGQAGLNTQAISQDTQAGNQMFGLNRDLSMDRIAMNDAGGMINTGQGIMDISKVMGGNINTIKSLGQYTVSGIDYLRGLRTVGGVGA